MTAKKYPELVAVEAIADALRTVDNSAWDRVVNYAKHLAGETTGDPTPPLRVIDRDDAAD